MMTHAMDIGNRKQLFIDNKWFFTQRGMTLTVNPPIKKERVLAPETPWESRGILAFSTVAEHDGRYIAWYDAYAAIDEKKRHRRCLCYATSEDGLHFERKNVNLFEWEGIKENSIVMPGASGGVMIDPEGPDEHRFKALIHGSENDVWPESKGMICFCNEHGYKGCFMELYLCTSPDGIRWKRMKAPALPFFHDTHNHFFYDTRINRYVAYVRWSSGAGRAVGRTEFDDPMDLPWPFLDHPECLRGPGLSRVRCGDELEIALSRDETDPPDTDLYTPCVHQYAWADDAYFSFTSPYRHYPVGDTSDTMALGRDERGRFKNSGPLEVQLAVSRDGINWTRPDRRPYVPMGIAGSWDGGQVYMALGMIRKGDEIWQYYSGTSHLHGSYEPDKHEYQGGLCRLVQRLDGFISADADYTGAEFTTPMITFTGSRLKLNVDCSAMGEVWVEIRDDRNISIPGYRMQESISVDLNRIAAPVRWKERDNVADLTGRPVRLHFKLRACKLYAFQFDTSMNDDNL